MPDNCEIYLFLRKAGCCSYCSLRFMRERSPSSYLNIQEFITERNLEEEYVQEPKPKVQKTNPCVVCVGLLQSCTDNEIVEKIAAKVGDYDTDKFTIAVSLPVSLHLRAHSLWLYLKEEFAKESDDICEEANVTSVKDVWKWIVTPRLATLIDKEPDSGASCDFIISVPVTYENEEEECKPLHQLYCLNGWRSKLKGSGPTRKGTEMILKDTDDALFKKRFQYPPSIPTHSASINMDGVTCLHNSIYVAGRYLKFSRSLSQTPWVIEGERKMKESVEELMAPLVQKAVRASSCKFSSSGREDVDVRTLGRGRPFVLDLLDAHRTKLMPQDMRRLEEEINQSTEGIAIRDLQIVPKDQLVELKQGEEEKTKQYMALCVSHDPVPQRVLDRLSSITDLEVMQKMPIRVLHRRPASCRPRIVHSMKAWFVSDDLERGPDDARTGLFKLEVVTQAGTYIKEFVHGDFGRTKPSLGELLGNINVDILALDVMAVSLDWPPAVNYDL